MNNQPMPVNNPNSKPVEARYLLDLVGTTDKQYSKGIETYNTPLMTHNGRDAGQDALDELVDAGRYITQLRMEKEELEERVKELEADLTEMTYLEDHAFYWVEMPDLPTP